MRLLSMGGEGYVCQFFVKAFIVVMFRVLRVEVV